MSEPNADPREQWCETKASTRIDRPTVRVWMPESLPWARLQTSNRGDVHSPVEYLVNPDRPMANLHLGGIEFGGYLADLELMIECCAAALDDARRYATTLAGRVSDD